MMNNRNDISISLLILLYLLAIMLTVAEWFEKMFSSGQKSGHSEFDQQYANDNPKGPRRKW